MTPTGFTLTLEPMKEPANKYEVAATLAADRLFELCEQDAAGDADVLYDVIRRAIEKMLAEGSLKVEVQWA